MVRCLDAILGQSTVDRHAGYGFTARILPYCSGALSVRRAACTFPDVLALQTQETAGHWFAAVLLRWFRRSDILVPDGLVGTNGGLFPSCKLSTTRNIHESDWPAGGQRPYGRRSNAAISTRLDGSW